MLMIWLNVEVYYNLISYVRPCYPIAGGLTKSNNNVGCNVSFEILNEMKYDRKILMVAIDEAYNFQFRQLRD